ncbi:MAG: hypothetical protein D6816_14505, partial [Bacteroidetes bacterium]
ISLGLCFLLSFRFLPIAFERLKTVPMVWKTLLAWEALRLISSIMAEHPSAAFAGMVDDVRGIAFGLLALIYLRSREDLIVAAKFTGIGLFIVSAWVLRNQLLVNPTLNAGLFETGTLSAANSAAVYTSIAIIILVALISQLPMRRALILLPLLMPLLILQIPYSSRSTILFTFLILGLTIYLLGNRQTMMRMSLVGLILLSPLLATQFAKNSLQTVSSIAESGELAKSPSLEIRWEIFQLLAHLSLKHPFGLGPRNHGLVDLNKERDYLREHFAFSAKHLYGLDASSPEFDSYDFNHPHGHSRPVTNDPHSQYAATLAETGPLGLALLGLIYLMLIRLALPLVRNGSDIVIRICGISGLVSCAMFVLGGLNVIVLSKAGTLILYGLTASLICCSRFAGSADSLSTSDPVDARFAGG